MHGQQNVKQCIFSQIINWPKSRSSGQHAFSVFGMYRFEIRIRRQAILKASTYPEKKKDIITNQHRSTAFQDLSIQYSLLIRLITLMFSDINCL